VLFGSRLVAYASAISGWGVDDTFGVAEVSPFGGYDGKDLSSRVWAVVLVACLVIASLLLLLFERSYPTYAVWWLSYGYLLAVAGTLGSVLVLADDLRRSRKRNFRQTLPVQALGTGLRAVASVLALIHILMSARDAAR